MNFKKIALVVAMSASFSVYADIDITSSDFTTKPGAVEAAIETVVPELLNPIEGNTAYTIQEGSDNVSYINQGGEANYAAVLQVGSGILGFVLQTVDGGSNNAVIVSKETGTALTRATGLDKDAKVELLAEAEIKNATPTTLLSSVGTTALMFQDAAGGINIGYIFQDGTKNFGAVMQETALIQNMALISQLGGNNRAFIRQLND